MVDRRPVLLNEDDGPGIGHGHHGHRSGVADDVPFEAGAVVRGHGGLDHREDVATEDRLLPHHPERRTRRRAHRPAGLVRWLVGLSRRHRCR